MDAQDKITEFEFKGMRIPHYMHAELLAYIDRGAPPGAFLSALLSNDLRMAFEHADDVNMLSVPAYIGYLYNHAPIGSWGSKENFNQWIKVGGQNGRQAEQVKPSGNP